MIENIFLDIDENALFLWLDANVQPDEVFSEKSLCAWAEEYFRITNATEQTEQQTKGQKHMKFSEKFQRKSLYLKAADLPSETVSGVVESVTEEEIGEDIKVVINFKDGLLPLILNQTNGIVLAEKWGDDMDKWSGKTVSLRRSKTQYRGKLVDCVRVIVA